MTTNATRGASDEQLARHRDEDRDHDAALVLLVDAQRRILRQHRDADAPRFPNTWGFIGGSVEDGESLEQVVRREVWEETGLTVTMPLTLFMRFPWPSAVHHL